MERAQGRSTLRPETHSVRVSLQSLSDVKGQPGLSSGAFWLRAALSVAFRWFGFMTDGHGVEQIDHVWWRGGALTLLMFSSHSEQSSPQNLFY